MFNYSATIASTGQLSAQLPHFRQASVILYAMIITSKKYCCYDYLGNLYDKKAIYFWDLNNSYEASKDGNVYFVANNFNELLEMTNAKLD